jgi:hypothetical protein
MRIMYLLQALIEYNNRKTNYYADEAKQSMTQIWQALGLTALFTIGSVVVVGGLMWLLYRYFNRSLPKDDLS